MGTNSGIWTLGNDVSDLILLQTLFETSSSKSILSTRYLVNKVVRKSLCKSIVSLVISLKDVINEEKLERVYISNY